MNPHPDHEPIVVDVALYGALAPLAGGKYVAQTHVELPPGARMADLLDHLKVVEKGFVFINAVLCDMPGLDACRDEPLHTGDHVGIFSSTYAWPYQYRDGARMTESLKKVLAERGVLHHSYNIGT